uniref:Uncharacterized protein n=1 Tax=Anguilla anguilla TaxID=7936 RepID=A0A0E9S4P1_ANGAN
MPVLFNIYVFLFPFLSFGLFFINLWMCSITHKITIFKQSKNKMK